MGSAGRLQLVPYGGSKPRSASKRQPHLRRQSLALAADKMAQVFRCNFLWGASCLSWAQTKRNKRYFTRRRMLHGGGSTARLRRRFHGQDPSTLVTHDTQGVPALLLILSQYHTHPHGMPRAPSALLAVCKWQL